MVHGNQLVASARSIDTEGVNRDGWRCVPLCGLWLIAIMPKSLQLLFFVFWMAIVFVFEIRDASKMRRIDFGLAMLVSMVAVHILSVVLNSHGADMDRLLAACNTVCIWLVSIALFFFYSRGMVRLKSAANIAVFNILVCVALAALASFGDLSFVFLSDERHLNVIDWLNGNQGERFVGFLEYPNLVSLMYFVMFPLSLYSVRSWKSPLLKYGYCILAMYPVFEASSRSGIMLAMGALIIAVAYLSREKESSKRRWRSMLTLGGLVALMVVAVNWVSIVDAIGSLLSGRQGSNATRSLLYLRSIEDVLESSPLMGRGIKFTEYPFGDAIPLGSHSTYIGILYKTGFLGLAMGILSFLYALKTFMKCPIELSNKIFSLAFLMVFVAFLSIEDVDGSNWSLAVVFIISGITFGHCGAAPLGRVGGAL